MLSFYSTSGICAWNGHYSVEFSVFCVCSTLLIPCWRFITSLDSLLFFWGYVNMINWQWKLGHALWCLFQWSSATEHVLSWFCSKSEWSVIRKISPYRQFLTQSYIRKCIHQVLHWKNERACTRAVARLMMDCMSGFIEAQPYVGYPSRKSSGLAPEVLSTQHSHIYHIPSPWEIGIAHRTPWNFSQGTPWRLIIGLPGMTVLEQCGCTGRSAST